MKLLRNGDKDNLDLIYIIAMKDSSRTDQETKDATETMEVGLQTLKFKDMKAAQGSAPAAGGAAPAPAPAPAPAAPKPAPAPAPAGGAAAPAPAAGAAAAPATATSTNPDKHKTRVEEYKSMTEADVKEYWKMAQKWKPQSVQYATIDLNQDGGKTYKGVKEELIDPFYTGPVNRAVPSVFVLKGTFAYLITGPETIDALHDNLQSLYEGTAGKRTVQ